MSIRYRLDDAAIQDLTRIADWYDRQAPGLGRRFIDDVARVLERIGRFPNAYARVHKAVRRARVSRFPYFVAYEVFVGELVVFAEAQHPAHLSRRAGED